MHNYIMLMEEYRRINFLGDEIAQTFKSAKTVELFLFACTFESINPTLRENRLHVTANVSRRLHLNDKIQDIFFSFNSIS
ncbi:hypothetical protein NQ315_001838 [Exocentrus adspersus]|uniref:Uncharacterized protein n=1 Tax=Exocentrus adspersus TaxID=1586481 RepID=A0AAV8W9M9_9CUCU|nr:hypothetical protein NQ315_001838 [Exocentrus adspersus]